jgi:hypothetical protein
MSRSFEAVGEPLTERAFIASDIDRPTEGCSAPPPDPQHPQPIKQVA